ncbi:vWA domain-containing protein [Paraliomyxa miuraensis]|uniref:vWA domain-containing protein n=1 Tax=Paraliomyxa miuraensis TaxID=376150 RepID=UPI00225881B7|nr:vWA domain-containing protein [Paraliomyxa miuraensis]MCX4241768.1 VWA domain-containing protein [Paraliomyxa miuraensis]
MSQLDGELAELGRRIERLTLSPASISAPLTRLFRPLLHRIRWKPRTEVEALRALVSTLARARQEPAALDGCGKLLRRARGELEDNLRQVERATVIRQRALLSYAAWLRRCYELLVVAERAVPGQGREEPDSDALILATLRDDSMLVPPLAMGKARPGVEGGSKADEDDEPEPLADPTRVLELRLDTIDHLMTAAREEDAMLGRRRRLLEAARQLLLETSAALALDEHGVQERLQAISRQITRLNRYEAAGLRPDATLLHQARTALSRGERDTLFAALSVLRRHAVDVGDAEAVRLGSTMIDRLVGRPVSSEGEHASLLRSGHEILGSRVVRAIEAAYEHARTNEKLLDGETDPFVVSLVERYYAPGHERAALAHALSVDGCFEVGGTLSPTRVVEEFIRHAVVPFPTQRLELVPAQGPSDVGIAVIHDPRTIIMDLAAGRLLARRFVREEVDTRTRTVMQGEVRVYLLDGSTSMMGSRARMRDAILVAELATLIERLENPRQSTRVVLYYRYFDTELGPVHRVDTPGGALEAIHDVTATPRRGGTNIEGALLSSMQLIGEATQSDHDLARGQIVLITDGEARVGERRILEARRRLGSMPVGISVIALGQENEALRELVAHQRAADERAFYHFVPDAQLERISEGRIDDELVHLPTVPHGGGERLDQQLGVVLEELVDLRRSREAEALRELDRMDRERRIERAEVEAAGEGERARLEALYRDDLALQRRYERWFPRPLVATIEVPSAPSGSVALERPVPPEGTLERDDLDSALVVLATIAEVVETVGSQRLGRMADAVELLERLLPDARLTPARYHEVLRSHPRAIAAALEAVHRAARSGLGWQLEGPRPALGG